MNTLNPESCKASPPVVLASCNCHNPPDDVADREEVDAEAGGERNGDGEGVDVAAGDERHVCGDRNELDTVICK